MGAILNAVNSIKNAKRRLPSLEKRVKTARTPAQRAAAQFDLNAQRRMLKVAIEATEHMIQHNLAQRRNGLRF
jgi:hypothetical protein